MVPWKIEAGFSFRCVQISCCSNIFSHASDKTQARLQTEIHLTWPARPTSRTGKYTFCKQKFVYDSTCEPANMNTAIVHGVIYGRGAVPNVLSLMYSLYKLPTDSQKNNYICDQTKKNNESDRWSSRLQSTRHPNANFTQPPTIVITHPSLNLFRNQVTSIRNIYLHVQLQNYTYWDVLYIQIGWDWLMADKLSNYLLFHIESAI